MLETMETTTTEAVERPFGGGAKPKKYVLRGLEPVAGTRVGLSVEVVELMPKKATTAAKVGPEIREEVARVGAAGTLESSGQMNVNYRGASAVSVVVSTAPDNRKGNVTPATADVSAPTSGLHLGVGNQQQQRRRRRQRQISSGVQGQETKVKWFFLFPPTQNQPRTTSTRAPY